MFFFAPSAGEFGGFLEGKIFFGNHFGVFARKLPIFMANLKYPLVNVYITNWEDPPFFMGKLTISTGPFPTA
jgi:hypothetical protein